MYGSARDCCNDCNRLLFVDWIDVTAVRVSCHVLVGSQEIQYWKLEICDFCQGELSRVSRVTVSTGDWRYVTAVTVSCHLLAGSQLGSTGDWR